MEEHKSTKALVLKLRFSGEGVPESPVHRVKVLEHTKPAHLLRMLTYGYSSKGYCQEGIAIVVGLERTTEKSDFDLFLVRQDCEKIPLDTTKALADYEVVDEDLIQIERKAVPISICVSLCDGHSQMIQVNAALPVVSAIGVISQKIGITHSDELSLAFPSTAKNLGENIAVKWLHSLASFQAQGVKDGDALLLRKKFFVNNDDITEAVEGNQVLLDLLCHQLKQMYVAEQGVPLFVDMATVSALLHHIMQEEQNISDEEAIKKVMPVRFQDDTSFYEEVVEKYYKEVYSLQKFEASCRLLNELSQPGMTTGIFAVKSTDDGQELSLVIDSMAISLCSETKGKLVPLQEWGLDTVKEFEKDDEQFKFCVSDEWHSVDTVYAVQIINYLTDLLLLTAGKSSTAAEQTHKTGDGEGENPMKIETDTENVINILIGDSETVLPEPDVVMVTFPEGYKPHVAIEFDETEEVKVKLPKGARKLHKKTSYMQLGYDQLLSGYRLFHFVIQGKDIRALLVNINQTVDEVILKICATYGIPNAEELHLCIPKGVEQLLEKFGGKPKSGVRMFRKRSLKRTASACPRLDGSKSLKEQFDFSIKPYVLYVQKYNPREEVDDPEGAPEDLGEEWPDFEEPSIARQREFHQCWSGVVQGDYPVDHRTAIEIAALLAQVYLGDYSNSYNKPTYNVGIFLPAAYHKVPRITQEVEEAHQGLEGKDNTDAMEEVIRICRSKLTYEGIFFDVEVIVSVIPWKKVKQRMLGINHQGVINVEPKTGKVLSVHRFSDICDGCSGGDVVHLNFGSWDKDYYAYSFQAREVMEILQLFIGMTKRGQIEQAPSRPPV